MEDDGFYENRRYAELLGKNPSSYSSWPDILMNHDVWKDVEEEDEEEWDTHFIYDDDGLYEINTESTYYDSLEKRGYLCELRSDPTLLWWWNEEEDYIFWIYRDIEYVSLEVELHEAWKYIEKEEEEDIVYTDEQLYDECRESYPEDMLIAKEQGWHVMGYEDLELFWYTECDRHEHMKVECFPYPYFLWWYDSEDYIYPIIVSKIEYVSLEVELHDVWEDIEKKT